MSRALSIAFLSLFLTVAAACDRPPEVPAGDEKPPLSSPAHDAAGATMGIPTVDPDSYRLRVVGEVEPPLSLSLDEVRAMPTKTVEATLASKDGWRERSRWTGVPLADVLHRAGVGDGADRVVFISANGYETSLSLRDAIAGGVLLAWKVQDETLVREQGFPLRVVAPGKYDYKWAGWVTEVRAIRGDHKGIWEALGYPNDGTVRPGRIERELH